MTAAGLRISPVDTAAAGLDRVLARLRAGLARYVDARSRAIAVRQLEYLGDATLADLGIKRGEIRERVRRAELPWS